MKKLTIAYLIQGTILLLSIVILTIAIENPFGILHYVFSQPSYGLYLVILIALKSVGLLWSHFTIGEYKQKPYNGFHNNGFKGHGGF